jgi:hypothetical protein
MAMNKQWFRLVGAIGFLGVSLGLATGCKQATCESVCEGLNGCEGKPQTPDCAASCEQAVKSAEDAGCKDSYNALIDCQGALDVCTSETFCTGQSAAYFKCVSDNCAADPMKCSGSGS